MKQDFYRLYSGCIQFWFTFPSELRLDKLMIKDFRFNWESFKVFKMFRNLHFRQKIWNMRKTLFPWYHLKDHSRKFFWHRNVKILISLLYCLFFILFLKCNCITNFFYYIKFLRSTLYIIMLSYEMLIKKAQT